MTDNWNAIWYRAMTCERCRPRSQVLVALMLVLMPGTSAILADDVPPPPFYRDKLDLMHWLDDRGERQPVRSIEDWKLRRGHILRNFDLATGSLPGPDRKVPLELQVTEVVQLEKYERRKLTFATEKNDRVPAYQLLIGETDSPYKSFRESLIENSTKRISW